MKKITNQNNEILAFIKAHGSITTLQAYNEIGVTRLSARIYDLRKMGNDIIASHITVMNRRGEPCTVCLYKLDT